jgi:hypothetical protein
MVEERHPEAELVYMVSGDDEQGDHTIFVTSDLGRAEARHRAMLHEFTNVRANWLEDWEGRPRSVSHLQ